jgi:acyl transferase domain-containing protein
MKPIAIVGMSGLFPQARTLKEFWENILNKRDCITEVPASRWKLEDYYDQNPTAPDKTYSSRGGFIPDVEFDPLEFGLPPTNLEVTDVAQLLSLLLAQQALKDAGYDENHAFNRERTGVILGAAGGQQLIEPLNSRMQYPVWERVLRSRGFSEEEVCDIVETIKAAYIGWDENAFPGVLGNVIAGRIANRFDLGGTNCTVDAACASSLGALRMALSELNEGHSDMMLTGGIDLDNSIFMYMCFSKTPAFSQKGIIRPFDADSDGMLVGEGIGMLVLKRLDEAERDGNKIYAVIRGMGSSSDGRFKSIYAPRPEGQALALQRAYFNAAVEPDTIGLLEAHGTGTVAGDLAEVTTLRKFFSDSPLKIALGSVKSSIGHTKAAAGAAGLIKVALALHHKILPATLNITSPNPELQLHESPLYLNTETRPWLQANPAPRRAAVSAFGFGGTNFHVVLEEYQQAQDSARRVHSVAQSVVISAPTPELLLTRCRKLVAEWEEPQAERHFQQYVSVEQYAQAEIETSAARLGFAVKTLTEARELLQIGINSLQSWVRKDVWQHPRGLYYRRQGFAGKVVALFPGQGSQYLEMGRELALSYPELRRNFEELDPLLVEAGLEPLSQIVFPPPAFETAAQNFQSQNLLKTQYAQPALGAFSRGLFQLLQQAGFQPDFLAGHSFGELTALWAAGVLDDKEYFKLVKGRAIAMMAPPDPVYDSGTMLAVTASADQLKAELENLPGVGIANLNSPRQTVLAGATSAINYAQKYLETRGFTVTPLPVSAAFHSPLVGHAQAVFAEYLTAGSFASPCLPVYSNASAQPYPKSSEDIREILAEHLLQPVLFQNMIENIYAAGGTIFVEVGPRNILTLLVKEILGEKPHLAVALNPSRHKDSDQQFHEGIAQLRVSGLPLKWVDQYLAVPATFKQKRDKGITVTLNAKNYVSDKTQQNFEKALNEVPAAPPPRNHPQANILAIHQEFLKNQGQFIEAFSSLMQNMLLVGQSKTMPPELLNGLMQNLTLFNQQQANAVRLHEQFLACPPNLKPDFPLTEQLIPIATPPTNGTLKPEIETKLVLAPVYPSAETAEKTLDLIFLEVVSDKTGYPVDILELEMDIEADLGIDSIKRIEILGEMMRRVPAMVQPKAEDLVELRTLGAVVEYIRQGIANHQNPAPAQQEHIFAEGIISPDNKPLELKRAIPHLKTLPPPDYLEFSLPEGFGCLITDDGTDATGLLAAMLMSEGWKVSVLTLPFTGTTALPTDIPCYSLPDWNEAQLGQTLRHIAACQGEIGAFIHLSPADSVAADAALKEVFLIAKHLGGSLKASASAGQGSFLAITHLDGQFGQSGKGEAIEAGLFGLVKSLKREWDEVFCRAIDFADAFESHQIVKNVLVELHDPDRSFAQIGYSTEGRVTLVVETDGSINGADK